MTKPKNVRNFWVSAALDGRQTPVETGTNGDFSQTIYMRDDGEVRKAVEIKGETFADGELRLYVEPVDDGEVFIEPYTINDKRGYRIITKRLQNATTYQTHSGRG